MMMCPRTLARIGNVISEDGGYFFDNLELLLVLLISPANGNRISISTYTY